MLRLRSASFEDRGEIPLRCAGAGFPGGGNLSPALEWDGAPEGTGSYAILMIDRHPVANGFVHWLVVDIPGDAVGVPEGASGSRGMPHGSVELVNTTGRRGYHGPTPPKGTGPHRYETTLYALAERTLGLGGDATIDDFTDALEGLVLDAATISGVLDAAVAAGAGR